MDAESKKEVSEPGVLGSVVVKKPLPPGALSGLWRNEELYHEYYWAGCENYEKNGVFRKKKIQKGYKFDMGRYFTSASPCSTPYFKDFTRLIHLIIPRPFFNSQNSLFLLRKISWLL